MSKIFKRLANLIFYVYKWWYGWVIPTCVELFVKCWTTIVVSVVIERKRLDENNKNHMNWFPLITFTKIVRGSSCAKLNNQWCTWQLWQSPEWRCMLPGNTEMPNMVTIARDSPAVRATIRLARIMRGNGSTKQNNWWCTWQIGPGQAQRYILPVNIRSPNIAAIPKDPRNASDEQDLQTLCERTTA